MPCLVVRHLSNGHWCGYVGVTKGHPYFKKDYYDLSADVHGGLTFSSLCDPQETPETGVCHIPEPGEDEHVWWLGFDCAHGEDVQPLVAQFQSYGTYKTLQYVQTECKKLALQLHKMVVKPKVCKQNS